MLTLIFGLSSVTLLRGSWYSSVIALVGFSFISLLYGLDSGAVFKLSHSYTLGELSYGLVLLSFWIMVLVLLASQGVHKRGNHSAFFEKVSAVLLLSMLLTFMFTDYLGFYISFEVSLIPTLILVLGWGYQPERIQAGMYMLFYTLFGSMPLLLCLVAVGSDAGSFNMSVVGAGDPGCWGMLDFWYVASVLAFLMKLPMYLVHLWLPKAHVEAPVAGSMVLAGVLLKLGGYGMIVVTQFFSTAWVSNSWGLVMLGGAGGVYIGFLCLRQIDMKALVAYSSVAHMGLVLVGLVIFNWWGLNGGYVVMLGHGLCSSGLFFLVNMLYERSGSRSLSVSKGAMMFMPSVCMWWFLLCTSNMAAPPSLNLLGEVSLIMSGIGWDPLLAVPIFFLSFLSGAYSLYLYTTSQQGKGSGVLYSACSGTLSEFHLLFLHWAPLNILFMKSELFTLSA